MPTYEAKCAICKSIKTYRQNMSNRDDTPYCCGEKMGRGIFSPPDGFVDFPATGQKRVWGPPAWTKDKSR